MPDARCECEGPLCGDDCLNRVLKTECFDVTGNREMVCSLSGKCDGNNCGNRKFQKRDYVKVKAIQEGGMGWGLKAVAFVPVGSLVIEYLGEVINEEEMQVGI